MGIPYILVSMGVQRIKAQEVGILGLIEPLLTGVWAYLAVEEVPSWTSIVGGGFLLFAIAIRYLPGWNRAAAEEAV